jgi:hypothetical protein
LRDQDLQREIEEGLNVAESCNRANTVICSGNSGEIATNRHEESSDCFALRILQATLVYTNYRQPPQSGEYAPNEYATLPVQPVEQGCLAQPARGNGRVLEIHAPLRGAPVGNETGHPADQRLAVGCRRSG